MSKKKSTTSTVNLDAVKRDVKKLVDSSDPVPATHKFGNKSFGELAPGSVSRQSTLEQDMGTSRYREMIHNHNSKNRDFLDKLPFTFPKKSKVRSHLNVMVFCQGCGAPNAGTENTFGGICVECKTYNRMENPENSSHDPTMVPGFLASATDLIDARFKKGNKE